MSSAPCSAPAPGARRGMSSMASEQGSPQTGHLQTGQGPYLGGSYREWSIESTKNKGLPSGSPLKRWVSDATSRPFAPLTRRCVARTLLTNYFRTSVPLLPCTPVAQLDAVLRFQAWGHDVGVDERVVQVLVRQQMLDADPAPHAGQAPAVLTRDAHAVIVEFDDIDQHTVQIYSCSVSRQAAATYQRC